MVEDVQRHGRNLARRSSVLLLATAFLLSCASTDKKPAPSVEQLVDLYVQRLENVSDDAEAAEASTLDVSVSGATGLVDLDARSRPMGEVVRRLLEESGKPHRIAGMLPDVQVTETMRGVPLETACTQLLARSRGRCYWSDGVLVAEVRDADPVPAPAGKDGEKVVARVLLRNLDIDRAAVMLEGLYSDQQKDAPAVQYGIDHGTNSVALTGTAADVAQAAHFLTGADVGLEHVMIEANVFAVQTSELQRLGAKLSGSSGAFSDIALNLGSLLAGGIQFTRIAGASNVTAFTAMIDVLLATEAAKVVARPFIGVVSGEEATIAVTNDRQVAVLSDAGFAPVTTTVSSGVQLKFGAIVRPGGTIRLKVAVEESTFVPTVEGAVSEVARASAATVMEVPSGQSVVIGGMAFHRSSDSRVGVPGLREIPLLGWLFGSRGETQKDAQLIVIVTPRRWQPGMDRPPGLDDLHVAFE